MRLLHEQVVTQSHPCFGHFVVQSLHRLSHREVVLDDVFESFFAVQVIESILERTQPVGLGKIRHARVRAESKRVEIAARRPKNLYCSIKEGVVFDDEGRLFARARPRAHFPVSAVRVAEACCFLGANSRCIDLQTLQRDTSDATLCSTVAVSQARQQRRLWTIRRRVLSSSIYCLGTRIRRRGKRRRCYTGPADCRPKCIDPVSDQPRRVTRARVFHFIIQWNVEL